MEEIQAQAEASSTPAPGRARARRRTAAPARDRGRGADAPDGEPDLTVRVIRDVFNEDFKQLVVQGDQAWDEIHPYITSVAPDLADRLTKWTSEEDLFTHHRVDEQLAKAMDRKVWLPSGGSLVIDRTEAMTVVDVNTGKFVGSGGNLEETVTKNNIEAAEEIVRQLRLRDIGGIIVIDFIDMVLESNRDLVVRRLLECLGRDRTKHQVAEVTLLGLVQMTRKRVGSGLIEVFSETPALQRPRLHPHRPRRPWGQPARGPERAAQWGAVAAVVKQAAPPRRRARTATVATAPPPAVRQRRVRQLAAGRAAEAHRPDGSPDRRCRARRGARDGGAVRRPPARLPRRQAPLGR